MAVETTVHRALGDPSRQRLLEFLRGEGRPLPVEELARASGLHPNTVRGHLTVLEAAELVVSSTEHRERSGRPRRLFQAAGSPLREHELLAEALAGTLAEVPDGAKRAYASGRSWGRYLVERVPPGRTSDDATAIEGVRRLLAERGFAPTVEGGRISMHACPFAELAARHTSVVCALHRGVIDGALEELGSGVRVTRLTPWAEPGMCHAELDARPRRG